MFRLLVTCGFTLALFLSAPVARAAEGESPNEFSGNLSTLGRKPDWSELEKYQATITHDEFVHLLDDVYCPKGYNPDLIQIEPDAAQILTESGGKNRFVLRFAKSDADRLPLTHWWNAPAALPQPGGRVRWPVSTSRSIPAISAGAGQKWKNAGLRSARSRRCRKAT